MGKSAECPLAGLGIGSEMVDKLFRKGENLVKLRSRQPMFLVSGNESPTTKVVRFPGAVYSVLVTGQEDWHASG